MAIYLKNGCYDSAIGWAVFNLLAPAGLKTTSMARVEINTQQRKKHSSYSLMNVGEWGNITQTEINIKL